MTIIKLAIIKICTDSKLVVHAGYTISIGKSKNDSLVLSDNISGISGATVSTSSMTKATNNVLRTISIF